MELEGFELYIDYLLANATIFLGVLRHEVTQIDELTYEGNLEIMDEKIAHY